MKQLVTPTEDQKSIANAFGYNESEIAVIQNSVAKGTSKVELAYFLNVCKSTELNPFNKEIWCYKDKKGNLLIFAGRDGFLAKAQKNAQFNGIRSCEVRENDEWSIDIANAKITHNITKRLIERGHIIGAYAIVFRKNGEPTIEYADFDTYNKGYNTWRTHPAEMIKKVAESHALKKAFGISGVQSEYEFNINDGVATPNNTKTMGEITDEQEYNRIVFHIDNAKTVKALEQVKNKLKDDNHKALYENKSKSLKS